VVRRALNCVASAGWAILAGFRPGSTPKTSPISHPAGSHRADVNESATTEPSGAQMYAVIKTGGKQYKVAAGDKLKVEQLDAEVGQEVVLDQVLAVGQGAELKTGSPLLAGASVKATVVSHGLHPKVRIFKMRRRKHYQRHGGHRQAYTELEIGSVAA
jgi:large subunit ribosomal protein L21